MIEKRKRQKFSLLLCVVIPLIKMLFRFAARWNRRRRVGCRWKSNSIVPVKRRDTVIYGCEKVLHLI